MLWALLVAPGLPSAHMVSQCRPSFFPGGGGPLGDSKMTWTLSWWHCVPLRKEVSFIPSLLLGWGPLLRLQLGRSSLDRLTKGRLTRASHPDI